MMRQVQVSVHGVKENAAFSLPCSSRSSAVCTLGVDSVKWCAQPSSQWTWTFRASCLQVWQGPVGLFDWDAAEDAADAVPQAWRRGSSRGPKRLWEVEGGKWREVLIAQEGRHGPGVRNKDAGVTPQLSQHCSEGVDPVRPWLLQR